MARGTKRGSAGSVPPGSGDFRTLLFTPDRIESFRKGIAGLPARQRWTAGGTCFDGALLVMPRPGPEAFEAVGEGTTERGRRLHHLPRFGQIGPPRAPGFDLRQMIENRRIRCSTPAVPAGWKAPGRVDLRDWFDAVEYQGFCASCVAFSLIAAAEATARISLRQPSLPSLSEAALFFGAGDCWNGWNLEDGIRRFQQRGTIPRSAAPYEGHNPARPIRVSGGRRTIVRDWYLLHGDPDGARHVLATHGPLVAEMAVHPEFFVYGGGVYRPVTSEVVAVHAMCVAGYDDRKGAWLCRNSFGTHWGEDGWFWLAYDARLFEDGDFWAVRSFSMLDGDRMPAHPRDA